MQTSLPVKVVATFDELKAKYTFNIVLLTRNAHYYVYRAATIWDEKAKKTKSVREYLGKITKNGVFIKRMASYNDIKLEEAKALISSEGGEIVWHGKPKPAAELTASDGTPAESDLKILTCLSMNSKISMSKLAEIAGVNKQSAYYRIKHLESRLGIKYLLEIDVEKLGYLRYLTLIKFEGEKPSREELAEAIKGEHNIQFVATTNGNYDVVMLIVDETPLKAHDNLLRLRQKESLSKYPASWIFTYFAQVLPFIPLRNQFIENIVKQKVWQRSKETPRPQSGQLMQREFLVLKELNGNADISFTSIDQKNGLNKGTSRYAYEMLRKKGIITRSTISMTNLPIKYIGIILLSNLDYRVVDENRYKYLMDRIEYGKISNKYCLTGNIGAPLQGAISFLPVSEEGYLNEVTTSVEKKLQGSVARSLVITDVIAGNLCYRRFDSTYTRPYRLLVELKRIEPAKQTFYG